MLRSILAVWSIALALLIVAATAGCQLGGCDHASDNANANANAAKANANADDCSDFNTPTSPDMAKPSTCAQSCGACATGDICYQPSAIAELPHFCAHPCADDRDCGAGDRCAQLFAAQQPAVCVHAGAPVGCSAATPNWHCDFPPASCQDASTAAIPFSDPVDRVCGTAFVHCANGCAGGACR